jgi:hypothetical protein
VSAFYKGLNNKLFAKGFVIFNDLHQRR